MNMPPEIIRNFFFWLILSLLIFSGCEDDISPEKDCLLTKFTIMDYKGGNVQEYHYAYDDLGRLTSIVEQDKNFINEYSFLYRENGLTLVPTHGFSYELEYNDKDQIIKIVAISGESEVASYDYEYTNDQLTLIRNEQAGYLIYFEYTKANVSLITHAWFGATSYSYSNYRNPFKSLRNYFPIDYSRPFPLSENAVSAISGLFHPAVNFSYTLNDQKMPQQARETDAETKSVNADYFFEYECR
jgi:hypothetical protein